MINKTAMTRVLASLALVAVVTFAAENFSPRDDKDILSYSIGYQVGGDFRRQRVEIDPASVVRGVQDALAGAKPELTPQEMQTILKDLRQQIDDAEQK